MKKNGIDIPNQLEYGCGNNYLNPIFNQKTEKARSIVDKRAKEYRKRHGNKTFKTK